MSLLNAKWAQHSDDHDGAPEQLWRSLDQLADRPAFRDWMEREFPAAASELPTNLSRRRWLQLMGASLVFGGLAGCRWDAEEFAPLTVRPQNRVPGERQYFATSWEVAGVARPLTVTSIDGRPIKVEGNASHPFGLGGTDLFDQAMILSLYDPDRSEELVQRVRSELVRRRWDEFETALKGQLDEHTGDQGSGLAIVVNASSSPTRRRLEDTIRVRFPAARWVHHEPLCLENELRGIELLLGERLRPQYRVRDARVIVCFDADPLGRHPAATRMIRDWSNRRDPDGDWMNRLYAFESDVSVTGSNADHRYALRSSDIPGLVVRLEQRLAATLDVRNENQTESHSADTVLEAEETTEEELLAALVDDLRSSRGQSLLIAGPQQPAEVHARVHRLNRLLENIGKTLYYTEEPSVVPAEAKDIGESQNSLESLSRHMESGAIQTLLILDSNPAYGSAASARFREALGKVPFAVHAGLYRDETGELCRWHVPLAHPLESWGDSRTWDGTVTLSQPLISPLFGGRTACELLALLSGDSRPDAAELIRETLGEAAPRLVHGEQEWRRAVHDGFVSGSALAPQSRQQLPGMERDLPFGELTLAERNFVQEKIELVVSPDRSVLDGRFANNGWLQETPDAITKLTWDNAAVIAPATAQALKVSQGDVIRITASGSQVELPVFVLPGVAADSIQLSLGYGRKRAGRVGGLTAANNATSVHSSAPSVGVDVSPLLIRDQQRVLPLEDLTVTGSRRELATTQEHFAIDVAGLEAMGQRLGQLVRSGTLDEYHEHADFAQHRAPHHPPLESLWEEHSYEDGHAWGMTIDLNRCIGCNACTVACQSENNVPIVGRDQVLAGREMHWLRVDRYFTGDSAAPDVVHQPVACHHCENAPCEQVCPVAATVHSDEGLNDMVYNRCIGTRYCANNCPYKVRRFNFFDYNAPLTEPGNELTQLILNPDVTVRSRGVMEKCTYCVQRIQDVKIDAGNARRSIEDGEVQTACQQACPAQAIVFGDLNDPNSSVAQAHASPRAYGMLSELNTKPRTRYLARIRNPHPWLAAERAQSLQFADRNSSE